MLLYAFAGCACLWLLFKGTRDIRGGLWILTAMVLSAAMSPQADRAGGTNNTWLNPLQLLRSELYLATGVLLCLVAAIHAGRLKVARIPAVVVLMLAINVFAGLLDMRVLLQDGALRLGLAFFTIGGAALVVTAAIETWDDFLPVLRAMGLAGVLWGLAVGVQVALDPGQLVMGYGRRFIGLLGNPQSTAVYIAPMATILVWLALNETNRRWRWTWIVGVGLSLIMVAWTGSRTAALMTVIGLVFVLYSRLGRAVFLLPVVLGGLYGLAQLATMLGIELPLDRLTSTYDTRSEAWFNLLEDALRAPLLGEGQMGARYVENAYLLGWVVYGPIMLALILILVLTLSVSTLRLWQARSHIPPQPRRLVDLITAYSVMYPLGAFFEWYIVARVDSNITFVVVFSCMSSMMLGLVRQREWGGERELSMSGEAYGEEEGSDAPADRPPLPERAQGQPG